MSPAVANCAAETVVSSPEVEPCVWEGAVAAGRVEAGSLVREASLKVGWSCRWAELPESVGAENVVLPVEG